MSDMSSLAAYLLARLDEDQARADGRAEPYTDQWHTMLCGERQLYWTEECHCGVPAQVLAEVAAKRAVIDHYVALSEDLAKVDPATTGANGLRALGYRAALADVMLALAQPYAGRDDFPPELHAEIADRG